MAVIAAIISSNVDIPIKRRVCVTGEVGLSGEIRQVTRLEQRITEAEKLGFEHIVVPANNMKGIDPTKLRINIVEASKVEDVFRFLFG